MRIYKYIPKVGIQISDSKSHEAATTAPHSRFLISIQLVHVQHWSLFLTLQQDQFEQQTVAPNAIEFRVFSAVNNGR